MECVSAERKWTLSTTTVRRIEEVMRTMVKRRYLPINGTARLVGGAVFEMRRKKRVSARRVVMEREIFSRHSGGNRKVITASTAMATQGSRRLKVWKAVRRRIRNWNTTSG